jgi:hypothetical protein
MRVFPNAVLVLLLTALLFSPSVAGQQQQPRLEQPPLALEVSYEGSRPFYFQVAPTGSKFGGGWFSHFGHIANWRPPANSLPVTAVRVLPVVEGDAVRVKVSVMFGEYHDKEKAVADYLVHVDEKLTTPELAGFGVTPLSVMLVKTTKPLLAALPSINNKTTSVETIRLEQAYTTTFPSFVVTLKNLAPKSVLAIHIDTATTNNHHFLTTLGKPLGGALIPPGGLYDFHASTPTAGDMTEGGFSPDSPSTVTIDTVIFDDGSYEGDAEHAAKFLTVEGGRWLQLRRIAALLDAASRAPSVDLRSLKTQVSDLTDTPNTEELSLIPAKYVFPDGIVKFDAAFEFKLGAHRVKQMLLDELKAFERRHPQQAATSDAAPEQGALSPSRAWVATASVKYSRWFSNL